MRKIQALALVVLVGLAGCAGLARVFGVETQPELEQKVQAVQDTGRLFGPYGELVSAGIAALLIAANNAKRNRDQTKKLTELATGAGAAIVAAKEGAQREKVAEILTDALPGKAAVKPEDIK